MKRFVVALTMSLTTLNAAAQNAIVERAWVAAPQVCGQQPGVLTCGGSFQSTPSCFVNPFYVDIYNWAAPAGQTITIHVSSNSLTAIGLTIQNAAGVIASNTGTRTVDLTYTFATSGAYYIGIGFLGSFVQDSYVISVQCSQPTTPQCHSTGTLTIGATVSAALTGSNDSGCLNGTYSAAYRLDTPRDSPITITYASSGYAPYMEAEPDTSDVGVFRSAKSPGSISMTYLPEASGNHWLFLSSLSDTPNGSYTVSVAAAPIDPCRRRSVSH